MTVPRARRLRNEQYNRVVYNNISAVDKWKKMFVKTLEIIRRRCGGGSAPIIIIIMQPKLFQINWILEFFLNNKIEINKY